LFHLFLRSSLLPLLPRLRQNSTSRRRYCRP
jgi:hypothetical protein